MTLKKKPNNVAMLLLRATLHMFIKLKVVYMKGPEHVHEINIDVRQLSFSS